MNCSRLSALVAFVPWLSPAAVLEVGPGQPYQTIQSAINAAAPGDTVRVRAGHYPENLIIHKSPLNLEGAQFAAAAPGRVTGTANPAVESVIAPPAGAAVTLASAGGSIRVTGFAILAAGTPGGGVVETTAPVTSLWLGNNDVRVAPGGSGCALYLGHTAQDATIQGNAFTASATSSAAVEFAAAAEFHGLLFESNTVLRSGAAAHAGIKAVGDRHAAPSSLRVPVFSGNTIAGHGTGFLCGADSLREAVLISNVFEENGTGFSGGPGACHFQLNAFRRHAHSGLHLASMGSLPDAGGNIIEENVFADNATVPGPGADVFVEDGPGGVQLSHTLRRNRLESARAVHAGETEGPLEAALNFWGAATGPAAGQITGAGSAVTAPFYTDAALLSLSYGASPVSGSFTVPAGQTLTGTTLNLASGATLTVEEGGAVVTDTLEVSAGAGVQVRHGSLRTAKLQLQPGAVLEVISGDLTLQQGGPGEVHTISGTFSFYDCLGSLHISGNTTFSGTTLGLVSDIHVAAGVTLLVTGSLTLDGCTVDSPGNFNVVINPGAEFNLVRSRVTGAYITIAANDVEIYDNTLTGTSLTVISFVSGPAIYHNVLTGGSFLFQLPGASVTTAVEGWGNVTSVSQVRNAMWLKFRAPVLPTRTLDGDGNLYVQPGDALAAGLDAGQLFDTMQAAEAILGFNSDFITFGSSSGSADWNNTLFESADLSGIIGRINSVTGLSFAYPDPNGTLLAGPVADFNLLANSLEGRTRFFFQRRSALDHPLTAIRYTASNSGAPYYREFPYTANSPILTIDGTPPVFSPVFSAVQVQDAVPVDVTQAPVITRQGMVTVTFDAMDALAGVDDVDVSVALNGIAGTITGVLSGTSAVTLSGTDYTRYVFEIPVTTLTPNGTYNIDASVMDRSGNVATLALGALQILKNQIAVTVQPQGLVGTTLTRTVVFTATSGSGAVLATWSVPVVFTGGTGTALLTLVPDGTVHLSAKMAWNLRTRLPANLDLNGQGTVAFTGAAQLRGGDFNGDNLINLADYNIMRAVFPSTATVPDINGDNQTTLADYNLFRLNWLTLGDPL